MPGKIARKYADLISSRSKLVVAIILLLTVIVGGGVAVGEMDEAGLGEFEIDSPETEASDFIAENYGQQEGVVSQIVVRDEGGNVLTQDSLVAGLEFQQTVQDDDDLNATLDGDGFIGVENVLGSAAYFQAGEPPQSTPNVTEQRNALANLSDDEFDGLLESTLDPDADIPGDQDPYQFLPTAYEPGDTTSEARLTLLLQIDDSGEDEDPQAAYDAQVQIQQLLADQFDDAFIFGQGISNEASSQATGDSFAIITPFALIIIIVVLGVAYRDVLDFLLAIGGIALVLIWMAGIMGWLEIPMNVILIAVPFLLVGLSIDYALHVVMRYREAGYGRLDVQQNGEEQADGKKGETNAEPEKRESNPPDDGLSRAMYLLIEGIRDDKAARTVSDEARDDSDEVAPAVRIRAAMAAGLASVILAIGAATFSTSVGFFSNIVSPLPAIRDFAVLSGAGILATFVIFGAFIPALKTEIDTVAEERFGWNRLKPAFGVGESIANRLLSGIAASVSRVPVGVIIIAFLLATGGAYGATTIDTEFNQADFLPEDPPDWTSNLPGPLQPGSYTISDDFEYLSTNFQLQGDDSQSQILIRPNGGEVTDEDVLPAIDNATADVDPDSSIVMRSDGTAAIEGPHTVLRDVASDHDELNAKINDRDQTGNGLPDEDVQEVYDLLFELEEQSAANVLSRDNGEITSARLIISVQRAESVQTIADDTAVIADRIEADTTGITAVATGIPVTEAVLQDALLENLVQAFAITLVIILAFLTLLFWFKYRAPSFGPVVLAPVVASLAWLLGVMSVLDISFNSETAVVTSLAIGLGVDYSIHAGERFIDERERHDSLEDALQATITGTGGALLASAGTTAAAFGVLALSLAPPLQRFGIVTGTAVAFAFFACITVLPCLLVVRERLKDRGS
ncbi:RND family transporter [Salinarchaeum sp. IM2453]|uniref:efflux RND transporter permease subunit n=1 Tax=Salinarchaeum sp. IM2453 TaxID=2862870 RepID=UPI002105066D|nr:MMPL family transporter [Salinarchaeum sp. IM2453]